MFNLLFKLNIFLYFIQGRYYPIEILYLNEPCDDYVKTCMTTAMAIHISEEDRDGDILIFLTGQVFLILAIIKLKYRKRLLSSPLLYT